MFNPDMDRRLSDLHEALGGGKEIEVKYQQAFEHGNTAQPARIWVDIPETGRRLVFDMPTAEAVAAQLTINGFADAAGLIRATIPVGDADSH